MLTIGTETITQGRETITREERSYFRPDKGIVLSDSDATMEVEITWASFNGYPNGWTFYEGAGGKEFAGRVEDESFFTGG